MLSGIFTQGAIPNANVAPHKDAAFVSAVCIYSLSDLERFSIADNQLEEIPAELGLVGKLTQMNLARNKLSEIPQELYKLEQLRKLSLARNSLRELPEVGSGLMVLQNKPHLLCLMHLYTVVLE